MRLLIAASIRARHHAASQLLYYACLLLGGTLGVVRGHPPPRQDPRDRNLRLQLYMVLVLHVTLMLAKLFLYFSFASLGFVLAFYLLLPGNASFAHPMSAVMSGEFYFDDNFVFNDGQTASSNCPCPLWRGSASSSMIRRRHADLGLMTTLRLRRTASCRAQKSCGSSPRTWQAFTPDYDNDDVEILK